MAESADWKKDLAAILKRLDLIKSDYTGKVIVNFNQGGITDLEKTEKIK